MKETFFSQTSYYTCTSYMLPITSNPTRDMWRENGV